MDRFVKFSILGAWEGLLLCETVELRKTCCIIQNSVNQRNFVNATQNDPINGQAVQNDLVN